ncbi:MAG: DUF523 and DUF1722 domain-containing protein [Oligoflexia bacterium]|nr:DUF523 and DUF1722 domain-containing protein [Oligoflexia bacterium]
MEKPVLGISSCILGDNVRFDGGAKRDSWVTDKLSEHVDFKKFCPEVEMGLGVPRKPIRLVEESGEIKLKSIDHLIDHTPNALSTFEKYRDYFEGLDGYIFMKNSPTCGPEKLKVYKEEGKGHPERKGLGIFYKWIKENFPLLPIIDSGRLNDNALRENFVKKVFAFQRFKKEVSDISSLQRFHQEYKYIFMEYRPQGPKELGQIAAGLSEQGFENNRDTYLNMMMEIMERPSALKNRKNVMFHILGYFKKDLDKEEKAQIIEMIEEYKEGETSYMAILKLLSFFSKKYSKDYLLNQKYFLPYPKNLKLQRSII